MKTYTYLISSLIALLFSVKMQAQTTTNWQPIGLAVTGDNKMNGVEAWYSLANCKNDDVVLLKFVNTTTEAITIEWFDAIFTEELKWVKKDNIKDKKTLLIPANSEIKADCDNNQVKNCTVLLKKMLAPTQKLKRYGALNFTIIK